MWQRWCEIDSLPAQPMNLGPQKSNQHYYLSGIIWIISIQHIWRWIMRLFEIKQLTWEQQLWHNCNKLGMMSRHESHVKTSTGNTKNKRISLKMSHCWRHQRINFASDWAWWSMIGWLCISKLYFRFHILRNKQIDLYYCNRLVNTRYFLIKSMIVFIKWFP